MFAVVAQGGKQYRVQPGDILRIERIPSLEEVESKPTVELADVRMVGDENGVTVGEPKVEGAVVKATVLRELRAPKILVFRKKKKKQYKKRRGHRQNLLEIRVDQIVR